MHLKYFVYFLEILEKRSAVLYDIHVDYIIRIKFQENISHKACLSFLFGLFWQLVSPILIILLSHNVTQSGEISVMLTANIF